MKRLLIGVLCLALTALVVGVPPASATRGHKLTGTFGAPGSTDGEFNAPSAIAVNTTGTRIYVLDAGNARVQVFDGGGNYFSQFPVEGAASIAVAPGANGDVYVADTDGAAVHRYNSVTGASLGDLDPTPSAAFTGPTAVAVDAASGAIYVGDGSFPARVVRFNSNRTFASEFTGADEGGFGTVGQLAVGGLRRVYVYDSGAGRVLKYGEAGSPFITELAGGFPQPQGVAAEPTGGSPHAYVPISEAPATADAPATLSVRDFDSSNTSAYSFQVFDAAPNGPVPIASTATRVYLLEAAQSRVKMYAAFEGPTPVTGAATAAGRTVDLEGSVTARGATRYRFEVSAAPGRAPSFTSEYMNLPSGSTEVPVSATVSGLSVYTTYYYRLVAENGQGRIEGQEQQFSTGPDVPLPGDVTVSDVTDATANVSAPLDGGGLPSEYFFEYGTTTDYGSTTPSQATTAAALNATVTDALRDLAPDTTYHVRLVADNPASDPQAGPDVTFTTGPPRPAVETPTVTANGTTAQLGGVVNPRGAATTYQFAIKARNSAYGATTAPVSVGDGTGPVAVSGQVSDLPEGGVFDVRLVATSSRGTASSAPAAFATPPGPPEELTPSAPIIDLGGLYGCTNPKLSPRSAPVKAGQVITLRGSDLGAVGKVYFGTTPARVGDYSSYAVEVRVPSGVRDRTPVTLNCRRASNAITVRTGSGKPKVSSSVKGTTATLKVSAPAAGTVSVSGKGITSSSKAFRKSGSARFAAKLSSSGRRALRNARSGRLEVKLKVQFKPKGGGATQSVTETVTFRG